MVIIKKNKKGDWFFRARARNGKIVAPTESYKSIQGAKKGIRALKKALDGEIKVER